MNRISYRLPYVPVVLILCMVACWTTSCAGFSGSFSPDIPSPETLEETDTQAAREQGFTEPPKEALQVNPSKKDPPGIHILTDPEGATVLINGKYEGRSPVFMADQGTGQYLIAIEKDGYYPEFYRIEYDSGTIFTLNIDLEPVTGFLQIRTTPEDATVTLDGSPWHKGTAELPIGRYDVAVRKFGYVTFEKSIFISSRRTTTVVADLAEAQFDLSGLSFSRDVFSPRNAGELGVTKIMFEVSDYGNGTLEIFDDTGELVYSHEYLRFDTWNQSHTWNGNDSQGNELPDGLYDVRITGHSADSDLTVNAEDTVRIDRLAVITYRTLLNGISGALFVPEPRTLPPFSFQISTMAVGYVDSETESSRIPLQISARFSPYSRLELDAQGTIIITSGASEGYPLSAGAAAKYQITPPDMPVFGAAVALKGSYYRGDTYDTLTNYAGGAFALPLSLGYGPFAFLVTPEVTISTKPVDYYGDTTAASVYVWGYGRIGFLLDFGIFSAGLSGALRTYPFHQGFAVQLPFQAGLETHLLIPRTELVLSVYLIGEFDPVHKNWYLMGGGGVGFLH